MLQDNILEKLILKLDQTPLVLISASKVTMATTGPDMISTIYLGFSFFWWFPKVNFYRPCWASGSKG